jgi:hypothetical protein
MTIQGLLSKIFKADQTQTNTVSWSGTNGLKLIQQDIVETIKQRTFLTIPSVTELPNQGFNNAVLCYVQDGFFYRWNATGTPNGITIFSASDGGVWIQESVGSPSGTITGGGTLNYVSKWSGPTSLTNGLIYDNGTYTGIGTTTPLAKMHIKVPANNPQRGVLCLETTNVGANPFQSFWSNNVWVGYIDVSNTFFNIQSVTNGLLNLNPSGGNVTVGSVTDSGYKFDVLGTFRTTSTTTLTSLSGVGTRMVVANASGILSTQAIPVGNSNSYGAWQDNATQTAALSNTGYGVRFDVPNITGFGVVIQTDSFGNNTLIKFANAGTYNIQFSFQFENADNAEEYVYIWLRKNGDNSAFDIPASNTVITIHRKSGSTPGNTTAAWNFFVEAAPTDFFQIVWATTDAINVTMPFYPATGFAPSTPSAILTVNQVN